MVDISVEICLHEVDAIAAFRLATSVAGEGGIPFIGSKSFREAFENRELVVGKDGDKVVVARQFHQIGDKIVGGSVSIHKDYRNQGLSKVTREFAVAIWKSRGATHEEIKILQKLEWLNTSLVKRGAVLLTTQRVGGQIYNVYHWEWDGTNKLLKMAEKSLAAPDVETERGLDIISRGDDEDFGWSLKKIPLVPGYWCVCVAPLREEWGDYAGKIFLAKSDIRYYPTGPPA
jgi:hypothetical protein